MIPNAFFAGVVPFTLIIIHVAAYGILLRRLFPIKLRDRYADFAVSTAVGLICLGFQMLLLGYFRLWHVSSLLCSAMVMSIVLLRQLRFNLVQLRAAISAGLQKARQLSLHMKFLLIATAAMVLIVGLSSLNPPVRCDEVQYHWAAPLEWARTGGWLQVPFRYMNGPCLVELLYLISALFGSYCAAHWTHVLFFFVLTAACMSLARLCGGSALAVSAACFATPVLVNQSALSFSDNASAALLVSVLVVFLCRGDDVDTRQDIINRCIFACILLMGAVSVKAALAFASLPATIFVLFVASKHLSNRAFSVKCALALTCSISFVALLWPLHTHYLTGKFVDNNCVVLLGPNEKLGDHLEAVGKIPSLDSLALLPLVPAITSVFGQQEPYGGRTGLIIVPFLMILALTWKRLSDEQKTNCRRLLTASLLYFVLLGAFTVRTRYLDYSWAIFLCLASVPLVVLMSMRNDMRATILINGYCLAVLVGMADASHVLLYSAPGPMKKLIPHFKFLGS